MVKPMMNNAKEMSIKRMPPFDPEGNDVDLGMTEKPEQMLEQ